MRNSVLVLLIGCLMSCAASAADKPFEIKAGEAIPASVIVTNHIGPFKQDLPVVVPMVVLNFQTEVTEKGGGLGLLGSGALVYRLDGVSPALMQKIADQAQVEIEAAFTAAGWQVLPVEKIADLDAYKSWIKTPDTSVDEVKRSFFSAGKATNTFSSKEMERVFVGDARPLIGNGTVLGGWTGGIALCKIGHAAGAKVVLFRALVNFASITAGEKNVFTGHQRFQAESSAVEIGYAEMQAYPPDASGATPARLNTDRVLIAPKSFIKDVQKSKSTHTIVADPERYEKDTLDAIRSVATGFVALSRK